MSSLRPSSRGMLCNNCKLTSHKTDDCCWLGKSKCDKCGWFSHIGPDCHRQSKRKNDEKGEKPNKKPKTETVNQITEIDDDKENNNKITFTVDEEAYNFDQFTPCDGNDERLMFYDWLADSATTSHVTNMRDSYTTFTPLTKTVSSVGNAQAHAEGKGTVTIKTKVKDKEFQLTLTDVLYIPTNPQSLLSLGRWDKSGGIYHGGQGNLLMNTINSDTVATGTRINNHLYRLDNFIIQGLGMAILKQTTHTFNALEPKTSWETWHRRFGHLGISSLQTLLDKKLVTSLDIDLRSPKYDCKACTEAKQHAAPYPKAATMTVTNLGELTYTDLWGKYPVQSIHGNQYFHTFLDDKS